MPYRLKAGGAVEGIPAFALRGLAGVFGCAMADGAGGSVGEMRGELSAFLRGAVLPFSGDVAEVSIVGSAGAVTDAEGADEAFGSPPRLMVLDGTDMSAFETSAEACVFCGEGTSFVFGGDSAESFCASTSSSRSLRYQQFTCLPLSKPSHNKR